MFGLSAPSPNGSKPRRKHPKPPLSPEQEIWFSEFWSEYWRKDGQDDARKAFGEGVLSTVTFQTMLAGVRRLKGQMLTRPVDKRPLPGTWLRAPLRWEYDPAKDPPQQVPPPTSTPKLAAMAEWRRKFEAKHENRGPE